MLFLVGSVVHFFVIGVLLVPCAFSCGFRGAFFFVLPLVVSRDEK